MFEKEGASNSMLKGRLTVQDNEYSNNSYGRSITSVKKIKNIENLLNNGYEYDEDRRIGVRKTEDKISIKF